jgi:hypothetical protein
MTTTDTPAPETTVPPREGKQPDGRIFLPAKFPKTRCAHCGKPPVVGELIQWRPKDFGVDEFNNTDTSSYGAKGSFIHCLTCPPIFPESPRVGQLAMGHAVQMARYIRRAVAEKSKMTLYVVFSDAEGNPIDVTPSNPKMLEFLKVKASEKD